MLATTCLSSRLASMKFLPLSLWILLSLPRRQINRCKQFIKLLEARDDATSIWTALVCRQVKRQPDLFVVFLPTLTINGPKKSTPECVKGGSSPRMQSAGRSAISCDIFLGLIRLHVTQDAVIHLTDLLVCKIQYFSRTIAAVTSTPP